MTKKEFLDEIKKELGFMPYEEVIKADTEHGCEVHDEVC